MIRNLFALLLLASNAVGSGSGSGSDDEEGGPVQTCADQRDHVKFTITPVTAGVNGVVDCPGICPQYRVCMELYGLPGDKELSHTCVKPPNKCPLLGFDSYKGDWSPSKGFGEKDDVGNGFKQCQIGSSGETIYFLLKDGNACRKEGVLDYVTLGPIPIVNSSLTTVAECRSRTGWSNAKLVINSCTGNKAFRECVWAVKIPQGSCGDDPVLPYDEECDQCAPVNAECRAFINAQPTNSIAYDITDCTNPLALKEDLKDYGCELSVIPNCNVILCASFVPLDAFVTDTITYNVLQCPLR